MYFVQGPVGSVQGLFASRYFRSSELGTFAPRNESSRELSLPGTFIPGNFRSWERHTAWDSSAHDQHPQRDITLQQSLRLYRKINDECSPEHSFRGAIIPGSELYGIKTFRSPVFSLLGAKVPRRQTSQTYNNLRSQERKFPGTFAPGNECSRELLFPGTFVPGIVSSLSDHGNGCWR